MKQDLPAEDKHRRPAGISDATVAAVGKLSEALERAQRARGALYEFHQLIGGTDQDVSQAADLLEAAGHAAHARILREQLVGRNVLPGRWTFQIVEEFDDTYWAPLSETKRLVRNDLVQGRRHIYESEMKEANRTRSEPGHEARP